MKTYEEMAQSAISRIEEYQADKKRKTKIAGKIMIPTISLFIILTIGIGVTQNNSKKSVSDNTLNNNTTIFSTKSIKKEIPATSAQSVMTEENIENNIEVKTTMTTKHNSKNKDENSGFENDTFKRVGEDTETESKKKLVSDFPTETTASYASPENGKYFLSIPLKAAIKEYGNDVVYRVVVNVFKDKNMISDKNIFNQEANRLYEYGYVSAVEFTGNQTVFTLHANADQLNNFIADTQYGYGLFLYDEYN